MRCFQRVRTLAIAFCLLSAPVLAQTRDAKAAKGTLSGFVLNLANGDVLNGAQITVVGREITAKSDLDGQFSVELPPGVYKIRISKDGFIQRLIEGIAVVAGETTLQDVPLNPEGMELGAVEVVASYERASQEALLTERKASGVLTDSIGAREMSKLAGSSGADIMKSVTGVSIVDNKFVYVRGLGERYSSTMLNGTSLPSTQPDKKVIPLDLFPASLLENIQTEKSYTPDQPGEFAGGIVKINTVDFPRRPTLRLSYGTGFGTTTTFKPFMDYPGGSFDFFGFDDGTRALPGIIPGEQVRPFNRFSGVGFQPEELERFGEAFVNVWEPRTTGDAVPNQKFNVMAGNTWGPFGLVVAFNQDTGYHSQQEEQNYYRVVGEGEIAPIHNYDFDISTVSARLSATANLAYKLSESHKILFRNFFTHDSTNEARMYEGFNGDASNEIRDFRLRFSEEGIYSGQVSGEHFFKALGNGLLEWKLSRSRSTRDDPDLRETLYERDPATGLFELADESQSGFRQFVHLAEEIWEPQVSWTSFIFKSGITGSIKVGASYRDRQRDFGARRFRFVPRTTSGIDLTQDPESIFTFQNIGPGGFQLREETRTTDTYEAKQINRSFFGMADIAVGRWRFVGGARVEADSQRVTTFNLFNRQSLTTIDSVIENADVLPAANVVYQLTPNMNLRGSVSQTLNRPEFRELAPFDFTDVVGGRTNVGFPDLQRATILNYDLRWEWFPSPAELISLSFFYKEFDQPIERVVEPTAQLRTSYRNAERATNFGAEFDFRRSLGFLSDGLADFFINANYTYVQSDVTIPPSPDLVLTSLSRPLAGQSRHIFNGIFEYRNPGWGTVARGAVNLQGRRITDVGALGIPDVFEENYTKLDFIVIQPFGPAKKWGLKFTAENMLDEPVEFTQGGLPFRTFKTGRLFGITLSYSFFKE